MIRTLLPVLLLSFACLAQTKAPAHAKAAPGTASAEATVKKLEQQWIDAVGKRDQAAVDALLAPDFNATGIDGKPRDRQRELATVVDTTRPTLSRFFGRLEITVLTSTVALTRGLTVLNGERIREAHIAFTHVWVLREGRWRVLASQETLENY